MLVVALLRDSQEGWEVAPKALMTFTRVMYYSVMRLLSCTLAGTKTPVVGCLK